MDAGKKRDILGMAVYFAISLLFGGGFGLLALIVHEDNDRCHYYGGSWSKGDLLRGCVAVAVGTILRLVTIKCGGVVL